MLSFPSQTDKKNFQPVGVLEKTDLDDGKPTYFQVWSQVRIFLFGIIFNGQTAMSKWELIKEHTHKVQYGQSKH